MKRSGMVGVATLVVAGVAGAAPLPATISPNGYGKITIGMSLARAEQVSGMHFTRPAGQDPSCAIVLHARPPIDLLLTDGVVARVETDKRGPVTTKGARVGDTETRIRTLYKGRVVSRPHKYVPGGHELVVQMVRVAGQRRQIVFETDGRIVTLIRAGRRPEVDYVEGCS